MITEVGVEVSNRIEVGVVINGVVNIATEGEPAIEIDSLDGGVPADTVYAAINANGLTGISGGTP
jgi:hypothetical protein